MTNNELSLKLDSLTVENQEKIDSYWEAHINDPNLKDRHAPSDWIMFVGINVHNNKFFKGVQFKVNQIAGKDIFPVSHDGWNGFKIVRFL